MKLSRIILNESPKVNILLFDNKILVSIFSKIHPCLRFWAKSRAKIPAFVLFRTRKLRFAAEVLTQNSCGPSVSPRDARRCAQRFWTQGAFPPGFSRVKGSLRLLSGHRKFDSASPSRIFIFFWEFLQEVLSRTFQKKLLLQMRISYAYGFFSRGDRS